MKKEYILTIIHLKKGNYIELTENRNAPIHERISYHFEKAKNNNLIINNETAHIVIPSSNINYIESTYKTKKEVIDYF